MTSHPVTRKAAVCGGRPCVSDTGIETRVIMDRFMAGDSIAVLGTDYEIGWLEVEAAIRFECALACKCKECAWAREIEVSK